MSQLSVSQISLPQPGRRYQASRLFRETAYRLLNGISIGSLTLHEEGEMTRFGDDANPGAPHAEVRVHDPAMFRELLLSGSIGAGESYMLGHWSSPDLLSVIRLFSANMQLLQNMDDSSRPLTRWLRRLAHALNINTLRGSRRNISAHYDLGNDFFELFLDQEMMYSSAVFPYPEATLEEAAVHKLDSICQQLELTGTDHLLEIGTGWGGMAIHAATHYGCTVTTTTLSQEQYEYTLQRVQHAGLEDRIEVLCRDYRELEGQYDKLVSIEMIEAVGHRYYSEYFARCSSLLKPGGLMVIQAITIADQRFESASRSVDLIQRHIFPGGSLPSIELLARHVSQDTDMQITGFLDITSHYAQTLAEWRYRFMDRLSQVRKQGFDDVFIRMWEFYLCYCEGGFRERIISTVQLTMAKPGYRFPQ